MKELNKKLAEWAELEWVIWMDADRDEDLDSDQMCLIVNSTASWHLPFTESLDVCFKWFKPKFISMACGSLYEDNWKGAWAKVITHKRETADVREEGIEPALALCLAIEKLINENSNTKTQA